MLINVFELSAKVAILFFVLSAINILLISFNKKVLPKLSNKNDKFKNFYTKASNPLLKYHKIIALISFLAMLIHGIIAVQKIGIPLTGVLIGVGMIAISGTGLYKTLINKKANVITIHIVLTLLTIGSIIAHYIEY